MNRKQEHEALRALVRGWRRNAVSAELRERMVAICVEAAAMAFRAIEREDAARALEAELDGAGQ